MQQYRNGRKAENGDKVVWVSQRGGLTAGVEIWLDVQRKPKAGFMHSV